MKQTKRTYLEMQLEEASLDSGRYNTDYDKMYPAPAAATPLLEAYRKAAASLGLPFREQSSDMGSGKLSGSN